MQRQIMPLLLQYFYQNAKKVIQVVWEELACIQGIDKGLELNPNGIIKICYPYGRHQSEVLGALHSSPLNKYLLGVWIFVDV